MRKLTDDKFYDSDEDIMDLEDKIYYGSDSSGASQDMENEVFEQFNQDGDKIEYETSSEYLVENDEGGEYGEDEMEEGEFEFDSEEEGEEEDEPVSRGGASKKSQVSPMFEFDDNDGSRKDSQIEYDAESQTSHGDTSESNKSTKVIEFDEEGNFLNMKDEETPKGDISLEMTDLKKKVPVPHIDKTNQKNYSQKKREKRRKQKELELKQ